jgi:hypothetical protein
MDAHPKRRWYRIGFSIRDLLLVTVIAALAVGWWLERNRAHQFELRARQAAEDAEASRTLSAALEQQLQNKNPAASIQINVRGRSSTTSTSFAAPPTPVSATKQPSP